MKNEKDASCKDSSDHDNESSMLKEKHDQSQAKLQKSNHEHEMWVIKPTNEVAFNRV